MSNIQVTLPDGAVREVPSGTTAAEVARQISPRLAKEALVARADGDLIDLSRPLRIGCTNHASTRSRRLESVPHSRAGTGEW